MAQRKHLIKKILTEGLNLAKKPPEPEELDEIELLTQFLPHISSKFGRYNFEIWEDFKYPSCIIMSHKNDEYEFDVKIYVNEDDFIAHMFDDNDEVIFDKTPKGISQFKKWVNHNFKEFKTSWNESLREGLNLAKKPPELFELIMDYEEGQLDDQGIINLFSKLVKNGQAWSLQGSYGRMASNLIKQGILDREGNILMNAEDLNEGLNIKIKPKIKINPNKHQLNVKEYIDNLFTFLTKNNIQSQLYKHKIENNALLIYGTFTGDDNGFNEALSVFEEDYIEYDDECLESVNYVTRNNEIEIYSLFCKDLQDIS